MLLGAEAENAEAQLHHAATKPARGTVLDWSSNPIEESKKGSNAVPDDANEAHASAPADKTGNGVCATHRGLDRPSDPLSSRQSSDPAQPSGDDSRGVSRHAADIQDSSRNSNKVKAGTATPKDDKLEPELRNGFENSSEPGEDIPAAAPNTPNQSMPKKTSESNLSPASQPFVPQASSSSQPG